MKLVICFILALSSLNAGNRAPRYRTRESRGSRIGTGTRTARERTWSETRSTWTREPAPDFAQVLITVARPMYAADPIGVELDASLYALDFTTIDLCLSLFSWARFRRHKAAIKLHTQLDLHGNIPTFIGITDGKVADVKMLDEIVPEAGAFYVMDRGYIDFERLYVFSLSAAFFVVRTKKNVLLQRRYSHEVDKSTGVRSDHTVILTAIHSIKGYPDALRRVSYMDLETNKRFQFLTNNFVLPALTIARIYKSRWQVELFFKWIKQHLRIKAFFTA